MYGLFAEEMECIMKRGLCVHHDETSNLVATFDTEQLAHEYARNAERPCPIERNFSNDENYRSDSLLDEAGHYKVKKLSYVEEGNIPHNPTIARIEPTIFYVLKVVKKEKYTEGFIFRTQKERTVVKTLFMFRTLQEAENYIDTHPIDGRIRIVEKYEKDAWVGMPEQRSCDISEVKIKIPIYKEGMSQNIVDQKIQENNDEYYRYHVT